MFPRLMENNEIVTHNDTDGSAATSRYAELQRMVAAMASDFDKFYNGGNKAAGTRVRNAMQELKNWAQVVRNEVSSIKNSAAGETPAKSDQD